MFENEENSEDYEGVSYDFESIFINFAIKETTESIFPEIETTELIKPICKKSIFRKNTGKIKKECVFSPVKSHLIKQIDKCPRVVITQPAITCSKLTIETLEQGVKYIQK